MKNTNSYCNKGETMVNFTRKPRYGYEDLLEIIRLLRSQEGCPWDKVQTHASIRRGLLEEAYSTRTLKRTGAGSPWTMWWTAW